MSQDMADTMPPGWVWRADDGSGSVEGPAGHHRCRARGPHRAEVAAAYGVSRRGSIKLVARYRAEGDAAFEPRSRRPQTIPTAIADRHGRADRRAPQAS